MCRCVDVPMGQWGDVSMGQCANVPMRQWGNLPLGRWGNDEIYLPCNTKFNTRHPRLFLVGLREGWQWKAHSAEVRQART